MTPGRLRYEGGEIGDRDAFRLIEPEMSDEEYQAYRTVWWKEFPCHCESACLCQGPPGRRPRRVRIFVELPDEPPQLTPAAARTLLGILQQKAGEKQNRDAEADGSSSAR
jgi:hypothetical protein